MKEKRGNTVNTGQVNGSKRKVRSGRRVRPSKRRMVGIREEEEDVGSVEDVGMRKTPCSG